MPIQIDSTQSKAGGTSLLIPGGLPVDQTTATQMVSGLKANHVYLAQCWVKTDGNVTGFNSFGAGMWGTVDSGTLQIVTTTGSSHGFGSAYFDVELAATTAADWTLIQSVFVPSADCTLSLHLQNSIGGGTVVSGNAWFDLCSLTDVTGQIAPAVTAQNTANNANNTANNANNTANNANNTANNANNTANNAVAAIAQSDSADYLTNADKISLMSQYKAELQTKSQLDSQATAAGVSSTDYDNAFASISTALTTAGAPANWATLWPDGTTSGPWTGIHTNLINVWGNVASARTLLQNNISIAQAASAKEAAISAAATDATTKMDNAISAAQDAANTAQADAIEAAAADATTKMNNAQAAAIVKALGMSVSDSIIPNGAFATGDLTGWATQGGYPVDGTYGTLPDGTKGVTLTSGMALTHSFQVVPGRKYKLIFWCYAPDGATGIYQRLYIGPSAFPNISDGIAGTSSGVWDIIASGTIATSATYYSYDWTPAANQNYASLAIFSTAGSPPPIYIKGMFCIPYVQAGYIDAGAVTTIALAADAVSASNIQASAITTDKLAANAVTTAKLAAGSVDTTILAAQAVQANNIAAGAVTAKAITIANFDNLVPNPNSELDTTGFPSDAPEVQGLFTGLGHSGNHCRRFVSDGSWPHAPLAITAHIPVQPGEQYYCEWWGLVNQASDSHALVYVSLQNSALQEVTGIGIGGFGVNLNWTNWTKYSGSFTIPAGVTFIVLCLGVAGGSTIGTEYYFDDFYLRRRADANLLVDGAVISRTVNTGAITTEKLDTNGLSVGGGGGKPGMLTVYDASGNLVGYVGGNAGGGLASGAWFKAVGIGGTLAAPYIYADPNGNVLFASSSALNKQGSILPGQPVQYSVSYTTNSLTITWNTQTIYRPDGSTFTINSGSLSYTGLTAGNTYRVYLRAAMPAGSGSTTITDTNNGVALSNYDLVKYMMMAYDGWFPVGSVVQQLPTSGSGGTEPPVSCPEQNELVEVEGKGQIKAIDVAAGDMIKGWSFKSNSDVYRRVMATRYGHCSSWPIVQDHKVSPCEPVYVDDAWTPAFKVATSKDTTPSQKIEISVEADEYGEHNYWLVSGTPLLIHNTPVQPPGGIS